MTKTQTVQTMSDFLISEARKRGVSLKGLNLINYNSFLDRVFNDNGKTRTQFVNFTHEFAATKTTSTEGSSYSGRMSACIEGAINRITKELNKRKPLNKRMSEVS